MQRVEDLGPRPSAAAGAWNGVWTMGAMFVNRHSSSRVVGNPSRSKQRNASSRKGPSGPAGGAVRFRAANCSA